LTGVIVVMDSSTYPIDLVPLNAIRVRPGSKLLVVAATWPEVTDASGQKRRPTGRFIAAGCFPHLQGNVVLSFEEGETEAPRGEIAFNGLLIEGTLVGQNGGSGNLSLSHCSLVSARPPLTSAGPPLQINTTDSTVVMGHCIVGGLQALPDTTIEISDSILDAGSPDGVAIAASDSVGPVRILRVENGTIIGKVHTGLLDLASNTIFLSQLLVDRRQTGCLRFCFVPLNAVTPRRYRCQPAKESDTSRVAPRFTSLAYGEPGYAQLSPDCPVEIFTGADDEAEMGAFHLLFEPQRLTNLKVRLDEYLRFGLEAGVFFER